MTVDINEGELSFRFPPNSSAVKYDDWSHYRNQLQSSCGGLKAVDIVFVDNADVWMIEVKDYRVHERKKGMEIVAEIVEKVRDSLAGFVSASSIANDPAEKDFARRILDTAKYRVVLHLEQPAVHSRLRPTVYDLASLQMKLQAACRWIDRRALVVNMNHGCAKLSWQCVKLPGPP